MRSDGVHRVLRELSDVIGCGVSTSGGMQNPAGHGSWQPA